MDVTKENFASGHEFADMDNCVRIVKEAVRGDALAHQTISMSAATRVGWPSRVSRAVASVPSL